MKKVTMGITLAALCLSAGIQDVDAGLFSRKTGTSTRAIMRAVEGAYEITQIEDCHSRILEAQANLNTISTKYSSLLSALQKSNAIFKGMGAGAREVFTADKKILDVLQKGFDAAINGSSESVFSTAEKDVARLQQDRNKKYDSIQSLRVAEALLEKYHELGISSSATGGKAGRAKQLAEDAHNAAQTELDGAKRIVTTSMEEMQAAVAENDSARVNLAIDTMITNLRSLKSSYTKVSKAQATLDAKDRAAQAEFAKRKTAEEGATGTIEAFASELKSACDSFRSNMTANKRPALTSPDAPTRSPQVAAIEATFDYYTKLQEGLSGEDTVSFADDEEGSSAAELGEGETISEAPVTKKRGFFSRFSRKKNPAEVEALIEKPAEQRSARRGLFRRNK